MKLFYTSNKEKYLRIGLFIAGMIVMAMVYEFGMWFSDNYRFQPLIVPRIISPVDDSQVVERIPTTTPTPKTQSGAKLKGKTAIVAESKYPDFIDHIWERETGRGSNKGGLSGYCLAQGKSNEFGFYPSGKHCFSSFEESVRRLERWYEDNKELTDNQKLCYYNKGEKVESCAYLSYNFEEMQ